MEMELPMVMTVLEARVPEERWIALQEAFKTGVQRKPTQMVEAFLVQSTEEPTLWRGVTVWRSRQALEEYRGSVATPGGVLIFRSVGAEPTLTVLDVAGHM